MGGLLLNNNALSPYVSGMMKTLTYMIALCLGLAFAGPSSAACYADFKAKKSSPLTLIYGVVKIPDSICDSSGKVKKNVAKRIKVGGWSLLNVVSVFGSEGLAQRQNNAGSYYLKY
ncbi:MAG: hypothetical protein ACI861_001501 [Paracoccaceae bacterium]